MMYRLSFRSGRRRETAEDLLRIPDFLPVLTCTCKMNRKSFWVAKKVELVYRERIRFRRWKDEKGDLPSVVLLNIKTILDQIIFQPCRAVIADKIVTNILECRNSIPISFKFLGIEILFVTGEYEHAMAQIDSCEWNAVDLNIDFA